MRRAVEFCGDGDLKKRDESGRTSLIRAAENGQFEVVRALVNSGVDVDACNEMGDTALMGAAYYGHVDIVRWLVEEAGVQLAAINHDGDSALDLASRSDIQAFLSCPPTVRHHDIHRAAETGHLARLRECVASGVNVDLRGVHGDTPLMWAALKGNTACVRWLIGDASSDPNAVDEHGCTALMAAARQGNFEVVRYMVAEAAVDIGARDKFFNLTAHDMAKRHGHLGVAQLLDLFGVMSEYVSGDSAQSTARRLPLPGDTWDEPPTLLQLAAQAVVSYKKDRGDLPLDLQEECDKFDSPQIVHPPAEGLDDWLARCSLEAEEFMSKRRTTARTHILQACSNPRFAHLLYE
ncbi:hypothetical protein CYMTET_6021 [Cymbomonas tetramitiformis]|uniref:Ankyrin repeat protein n=1 Tax=Cymbomonas tetramitiformis TaxID=36881 RepID=A0AAE0GYA7_9CHLO|nr:hypothetical protein CYMTET_6021 [Cymbomonas tetramitiformis]